MSKPNAKELIEEAQTQIIKEPYIPLHIYPDTIITLCECLIEAEKALENIRNENERFSEEAVMDWDGVQDYAQEALASLRSRIEFGSGES